MLINDWLNGFRSRLRFPSYARTSMCRKSRPRRRFGSIPSISACVQVLEERVLLANPVLTMSTYLGGSRNETVKAVATDAQGDTYVVGDTHSANFAHVSVPDDGRLRGFITKLDAGGQLVYTNLLGPVDSNSPYFTSEADAVKVGPDGLPIVSFELTAMSEPVGDNQIRSITGATRHVMKLTNDGATLFDTPVASWTLGEGSSSMAVDEEGSAYLSTDGLNVVPFGVGNTRLDDNAFIVKVDATGTPSFKQPFFTEGDIAVDAQHNIYLATRTDRDDYPFTNGAFQSKKASPNSDPGTSTYFTDIYVAELDPTASGLIAATYLGGSGNQMLGVPGSRSRSAGNCVSDRKHVVNEFPHYG